jgi:hypothetical protein
MIRKIKTQENVSKEQKRKKVWLGIGMVLLLVFSTLGYSFSSYLAGSDSSENLESEIEYNGFDLEKEGFYWNVIINEQDFYLQFSPEEVEQINSFGLDKSLSDYSNKPLYFVGGGAGVGVISGNLNGHMTRSQEACLEGFNCTNERLPIKTCLDNVIIFNESSNLDRVYSNENCVFIEGDSLRGSEVFLYKILGIIG